MKRKIRDLKKLEGKRILLRCDFNVPLDKYGDILDNSRIVAALPTIKYLVEHKAKVVVVSHLGRPKGYDKHLSLFPVAVSLMKNFPKKVKFCNKVTGPLVDESIKKLGDGEILLLENLRFDPGEAANDVKFVNALAKNMDFFVNDAFGVAHRKQASNYGVALKLPNAMGLLLEKEIEVITKAVKEPKKPFVAVFGGAKVQDKLLLIKNVLDKADTIIIGGGMAYTFLQAQGINTGNSIVVHEHIEDAKEILLAAKKKGVEILLPIDHVVTYGEKKKVAKVKDLKKGMIAYDIGKKTSKLFCNAIKNAKQVIWNGPLGMYEEKPFRQGTLDVAKALAKSKAYSIVGGGDSVSAIKMCKVEDKISHLSTGGGASLKLLEGKILPAVEAINSK